MDIRQIAKRAKVSTATVSRTVNNLPTVHPRLAKRVWKAVEELGYFPNTQARALVSGRSRIFGLIISEITNPFFPEIIHVFESIALQHGYEILITSTVHDLKRMQAAVRRMLERRVDGVAVLTFGMEDSVLNDLKLRNVPLVFVDVGPPRSHVSNIKIDYLNGIREAVHHLAELKHRHIGFISGPLHLRSALARRDAFVASMQEAGLQDESEYIIEGNHTIAGGMGTSALLLTLDLPPTAVVCSNDLTAIGVMRKSHELGVSIPRDLSLVGFDNIRFAEFTFPPLTTVEMSQAELAKLAFHALFNEAQQPSTKRNGSEYLLTTSLVIRGSTAAPRERALAAKLGL